MPNYLDALKQNTNFTYTENGALTNASSLSSNLDLFSTIGAIRYQSTDEILRRFHNAYSEDKDLAIKILFFARDIRGGLGERRVFREILKDMAFHHPETVKSNISHIAEYGRWDDLLSLIDTPCERAALVCISAQLEKDKYSLEGITGEEVSLLAKWLPSVNATSKETVKMAKKIAKSLGLSDAEYRKTLSSLRNRIKLIENNLREKDYTFDYSKQPSKAMLKYRKAFIRNDKERYAEFLHNVDKGEAKLNTGTLYPYEIVNKITSSVYGWRGNFSSDLSEEERRSLNTTWNQLPDYTDGENYLAIIDGSGSMYNRQNPQPADVALSLGLYFGEHNKGLFHNYFITFSERPRLIEIKGEDLVDKISNIMNYSEIASTNIEAVFDLLLDTAVQNHIPQEEMPSALYIISDMEFDSCTKDADITNFQRAKSMFEFHGYKLPRIVFWNVASRHLQQPVTKNDRGVALVSGCTPKIFELALSEDLDPMSFMLNTINTERYEKIKAYD